MSIKDSAMADELLAIEKIEQEQNEIIDKELKFEKELEEYKTLIAQSLLSKKTGVTVNIDGRMFVFGYAIEDIKRDFKNVKVLKLIVIDIMMAKLSKRQKGQYTITLDYVRQMSLSSNLEAAIEAFLRNLTGTFKAEHEC